MKYRTFQLQIEKRSEDSAFYPAVLSSEAPVERDFGLEILSHRPGEVDMSRARRSLPLLWNHDTSTVIGRVQNIRLSADRKLRGELTPGNSNKAKELWQDVRAGVVGDISIGYHYGDSKPTRLKDGALLFKNWVPHEISLVSIPADANAGIGRSKTKNNRRSIKMDFEELDEPNPKRSYTELENMRIRTIRKMCKMNNISRDLEDRMVDDTEMSVDRASSIVLQELQNRSVGQTYSASQLGLSNRELKKYSIGRAIMASAKNDWSNAGLELEASKAFEQRTGRRAQGFFVPSDVLIQRTVQKGAGIATVGTDTMAGSFIDLLRNQSAVISLGCTMLPGLVGECSIPRQTAAMTASWVAESTAPTATDITLDALLLKPKTLAALTSYSRKMLLQSTPGIEGIITNDLARIVAIEIDRAAINGSGTGSEPKGILKYVSGDGIGVVTTTGTLTWAKMVEFESTLGAANGDIGRCAYLTSAKVRGRLKTTLKTATYGEYNIWEANNTINGYPAVASNNVPDDISTNKSGIIFGNFADLVIAEWGAVDIVSNPWGSTDFGKGDVSVRVMTDVDIGLRHVNSFVIAIDV